MLIKNYRVAWCPVCNQGWVEIVKEEKSGSLYFCCDECEAEWTDPEDIGVWGKGSRCRFGQAVAPALEDIKAKGWERYIQN